MGGRLGQLVADKLQRNYQVKGSIGLVLGFFSIVGAAGAGFLGYKGVGSSSKPAALPAQGYGAPPGAPPQSYGPPPQQNYGAPQDQNYGAAMQNYGAPPQQGGYGAPPQQGGYGAPPQQGGFGAPPQPPPGSWGGGQG